jgi:hypothetical protein
MLQLFDLIIPAAVIARKFILGAIDEAGGNNPEAA